MGKKSQLIKLITLGTAIAFNNITVATAEQASLEVRQDAAEVAPSNTKAKIIDRVVNHPSRSDSTFSELMAETVAQEVTPRNAAEEIIKPAQPSITNTQELNPSGNPLSFPTDANEVQVGDRKAITLEQAIELSLNNNKEIEQARLELERANFALREEKAALFPTLDFSTSFSFSDDAFLDAPLQQTFDNAVDAAVDGGATEEEAQELAEGGVAGASGSVSVDSLDYNSNIGINYVIFNGGLRGASIRAAEKQLRFEELDLERIVEDSRLETASDYYDLQDADAQVEIQQAAVEDAQQTLKDAQLLEQAGLGTRFDVLRAETELAQAQQALTTASANQNITRRQLAETLSVSHSTELSTADAIEVAGAWEVALADTIVLAFQNRAELEQFLLQKEISEEQRTIALSATRPSIGASADYSVIDDFKDDFDTNDQVQLGINIQWQLFDGGAARAGARQAETDAEIAETQFADQRNQIRFAVEQAFFLLESNLSNVDTATKQVQLAEESLRLARLRFQAGVGTQTDVIEAQTELTTARGNLLSSITDYNQSFVDLNRQVSNTPDNGLQDLP